MLTTGVDNFAGTAGNDTIVGTVTVESTNGTVSGGTLNTGDQINGGAGTDTLSVTVDGALKAATATAIPTATVTGVETLNVRAVAATATGASVTVDASQFPGLTAFNADRATDTVSVTNLATGAAAGMIGNGTVANGALNLAYATGTDAVTINVAGGTKNVANAAKIAVTTGSATAATINSTGAANAVDTVALSSTKTVTGLTINAATNLTTGAISGFGANAAVTVNGAAASVNVGTLDAAIKTVDASGLTAGGLTATLNTTITSFKGGAGNDIITAAATTATGASIDAGAGTGDVLVVDSTASNNDIATNGAAYKNFEVLKNTGTTATQLDVSKVSGITAVETAAAGAGFAKLTAGEAASIKVSANLAATATAYALADATGTADVLGLNFTNATATTVENATNLTVTGFETLNLTAGSGGSNVNFKADGVTAAVAGTDYDQFKIGAATTDLKTVTLAGAYAAQIDLSTNATKVTTIDASANTAGADIITGGQVGALTVTGTAAADKISVGTMGTGGSQTINAGAGDDKISGAQADIYAATINGGAGTDTLTLTDSTVTVNDQTFKNVTGVEKLAFAATSLNFLVGGYANSNFATANGGVLDVTAASLNDSAVTSIDATGLSGSNSLKLSATVTASAGTNVTADVTIKGSLGGADSITLKTVDAATKVLGNITIDDSANTSAGVTIDASSLAGSLDAGKVLTIKGGAGADTIKGGALAETIVGGAGNDIINLLSGHTSAQTLQFAADSGTDTVSNFTIGTDILKGTVTSTAKLVSADIGNGWTVSANGMASKAGATAADFVTAATAVTLQNGVAAAKGVVGFDDGHNTWVVYTDGTSNTTHDSVIELVGVTGITTLGAAAGAGTIVLA